MTVSQLFVFSLSLFLREKKYLSHQMLGIHFLGVACTSLPSFSFKFFNIDFPPAIQNYLQAGNNPFNYLWGPTLYWYVKSVVFSNFRLRKQDMYHLIPFVLASIILYILIRYRYAWIFPDGPADHSLSYIFFKWITYICLVLQTLVYNLLSLKVLITCNHQIKETSLSISKKNIDWLNFFVTGFIGWYIFSIVINVYYILSKNVNNMWPLHLFSFIFYNIIYIKGWHQPGIFTGIEEKYRSRNLSNEEAGRLIVMIKNYLTTQKSFLTPGLTINQVARSLNISTHLLSRVLNEYFHKNFSNYINSLRIEEAKKILQNPTNNKTILEILFEIGFNSKATFNTYFKKETGLTPSEFKNTTKTHRYIKDK